MAPVQETTVVVVGAGPAGLAVSACLTMHGVPTVLLEKEYIHAPLWKKKAYDRLRLHLAKQFCELPHMAFPPEMPTYIPKDEFIRYLDSYVSRFGIEPLCRREVVSAEFNGDWVVEVKNTESGTAETYVARFLVVATGENAEGRIPDIPGLETFSGEATHVLGGDGYKNGKTYGGKDVLVVGCGNSGMEIALDLCNWEANVSIVIRSPFHVLTDDMVRAGMELLSRGMEVHDVDEMIVNLANAVYGDLTEYGIKRPTKGPFYIKNTTGRSAVIDVGTIAKIKSGEIKVFPAITAVDGDNVHFADGEVRRFESILFATGFNSSVQKWLKDDGGLFGEDGMPKARSPNHWKGDKRIYCTGFAQAGLWGICIDAKNIADDIVNQGRF